MFQAKHNLDVLIQFFGSAQAAYQGLWQAAQTLALSLALMVRSKSWL